MASKLRDKNYITRCQHCEKVGVYTDKDITGHINPFKYTINFVECVWCSRIIPITLTVGSILHYRRTEASNETRTYADSFDEDQ